MLPGSYYKGVDTGIDSRLFLSTLLICENFHFYGPDEIKVHSLGDFNNRAINIFLIVLYYHTGE